MSTGLMILLGTGIFCLSLAGIVPERRLAILCGVLGGYAIGMLVAFFFTMDALFGLKR